MTETGNKEENGKEDEAHSLRGDPVAMALIVHPEEGGGRGQRQRQRRQQTSYFGSSHLPHPGVSPSVGRSVGFPDGPGEREGEEITLN